MKKALFILCIASFACCKKKDDGCVTCVTKITEIDGFFANTYTKDTAICINIDSVAQQYLLRNNSSETTGSHTKTKETKCN